MRLILATALATVSTSSPAQQTCAERDIIVTALAERHRERQVSQGLTADGNLLEVYASPHGTWTVIVTPPSSGISCVVQAGTDWDKPPGRDA